MNIRCLLTVVPVLLSLWSVSGVKAQLVPDRTLGSENSVVTPIDQLNDRINGGAARGANLFHSFLEFNIGEGRSLYFTNPTGIENILTRVTGGNPSNIFGRLGVLGDASLWLINPNGINFGPNASLDIRGSFLATTADGIQLGENGFFSATDLQNSQLLTVQPGVLFNNALAAHTGKITNQGNLSVGQNLTLASGNLDLQGQFMAGGNLTLQALDTVKIRDSIANPFIAKAGGSLLVQGDRAIDIFALNHPHSGLFSGQDMVLRSPNSVIGDAHYYSGGNFRIEKPDGSLGSLASPNDPIIRSLGDVSFWVYEGASLHIFAAGSVYIPGYVWIQGADPANGLIENVTLSDGTTVSIDGQNQPTLDIRAGMTPEAVATAGVTGDSGTFYDFSTLTDEPTSADIYIGGIYFYDSGFNPAPGKVLLTNQYSPNAALPGGTITVGWLDNYSFYGDSGDVFVDASAGINLTGDIYLSSLGAVGNGGNAKLIGFGDITTGNIFSEAAGIGNGGNVSLTSETGSIDTTTGVITTQISDGSGGTGNGGAIAFQARGDIRTGDLNSGAEYSNGSSIQLTSTNGTIDTTGGVLYSDSLGGNAGAVELHAFGDITTGSIISPGGTLGSGGDINITSQAGNVSVINGWLLSSALGVGKSGNITIKALDSVTFNNETFLEASNYGQGNAGSVEITASNAVNINGSWVESMVAGTGNSGGITINAGSLSLTNFSELNSSVTPDSTGNAGNININVRDLALFDSGRVVSRLEEGATGRAGDININTGSLLLTGLDSFYNVGQIVSASFGDGDAGNVTISARDTVTLKGLHSDIWSLLGHSSNVDRRGGEIRINAGTLEVTDRARIVANNETLADRTGRGYAGNIKIDAGLLSINNKAEISSSSHGPGDAGDITINTEAFVMDNSTLFNRQINNADGQGGNLTITTGSFSAINGSEITSKTHTQADSSNIFIKARDLFVLDNSAVTSAVNEDGRGAGGDIDINVTNGSLLLTNNAKVTAGTYGVGNAGRIALSATDSVSISNGAGIESLVAKGAVGDGNEISIQARSLFLTNNAELSASTNGRGNAGGVKINTTDTVSFDNSWASSAVESLGIGDGGNVDINTRSVALTNDAKLLAFTAGQGNAGSVNVDASDTVAIDRSTVSSAVEASGIGNGGNVEVNTRSLSLTNGTVLSSSTNGQGNAGGVRVDASDTVAIDRSTVSSAVEASGIGNGGNVDVNTRSLSLTNGAALSSSTSGQGNAGRIAVVSSQAVFLNNSSISTAVNSTATANQPATIEIATNQLALENHASITANTIGNGPAGNISLNADQVRIGSSSEISAATGGGAGGSIRVTANSFTASSGGKLVTTTSGSSDAGNISLLVRKDITLTGVGSGLFANTSPNSSGNGGSIFIDPLSVTIQDGAGIAVNSAGEGAGGDIKIIADTLTLNERAFISAETASNQGGNITLNVRDLLLMRHNSLISATAGTEGAGGDGGNITINARFIVGVPKENSDITANAFQGRGGNITITTNGIFGLAFRNQLTPLSDITASSQFGLDGTFTLNTPGIDPTSGLNELPEALVDAEGLVGRDACAVKQDKIAGGSSFIITGRGGLPPNPNEPLTPTAGMVEWASRDRGTPIPPVVVRDRPITNNSQTSTNIAIQQAQGWVMSADGTVILTAQAPTVTPQSPGLSHPGCHLPSGK